jgi:hypothetical protein
MTEAASTVARDLKVEVKAAWAVMDAPPPEDMEIMDWEYGKDAERAFVGVRPADVDIDSPGFLAATPLLELPGNAAAAYLGPYLVSLLKGFQIQEAIGVPVDTKTRAHTLFAMAYPDFWTATVSPHLNGACMSVLGKVTRFTLEHSDAFTLSEEEKRGLERLVRSIERRLKMLGSR